jgi:hypothetical protein
MAHCAECDWIIERKSLFEMRLGWRKPADKEQISTRGEVTHNAPGGIAALAAQTQQILVQAQRQIEFTAVQMID